MCLDPECKYIAIIEDENTGDKCYIHYKLNDDSTYTEILVEKINKFIITNEEVKLDEKDFIILDENI